MGVERSLRASALVVGVLAAVLAAGCILRVPLITRIWPFAAVETKLGFLWIGSVAAAILAPTLWIMLSGELRAASAGCLNLVVTFGGMAAFLAVRGLSVGRRDLLWAAAVCAAIAVGAARCYVLAGRVPWRDDRPVPGTVRVSFAVFAAVLILAGSALVARVPRVFPWPLAPESSVMYGVIFLGDAVYFAHGFFRPRWANAVGQLLAFLAYDLVLVEPFLRHYAAVRPAHLASLATFTIVIFSSGLVAAYYLFLNAPTRLGPVRVRLAPSG